MQTSLHLSWALSCKEMTFLFIVSLLFATLSRRPSHPVISSAAVPPLSKLALERPSAVSGGDKHKCGCAAARAMAGADALMEALCRWLLKRGVKSIMSFNNKCHLRAHDLDGERSLSYQGEAKECLRVNCAALCMCTFPVRLKQE